MAETFTDGEMRGSTVNSVQKGLNSENEAGAIQSLAILEFIIKHNAKSRILNSEDVLIVKGRDLSQIEATSKTKESFRAFTTNAPKIGKSGKVVGMNEFSAEWGKSLEG